MRIPYSMNMNFSVGREFNNGLFVQASYVGRLSRSTPLERDLALHTNLMDPQSGVHYFQAAEQYELALDTPVAWAALIDFLRHTVGAP